MQHFTIMEHFKLAPITIIVDYSLRQFPPTNPFPDGCMQTLTNYIIQNGIHTLH